MSEMRSLKPGPDKRKCFCSSHVLSRWHLALRKPDLKKERSLLPVGSLRKGKVVWVIMGCGPGEWEWREFGVRVRWREDPGWAYFGFSIGSGSLRPSPTGLFSASSPETRCSSASTFPWERKNTDSPYVHPHENTNTSDCRPSQDCCSSLRGLCHGMQGLLINPGEQVFFANALSSMEI